MAEKKNQQVKREQPPTDNEGRPASQESKIRDAKHPDEKPDQSTVAQVEEVKGA